MFIVALTSSRPLVILTSFLLVVFRFTVSGGSFSATISARDSIAIHTGALGTGSGNGSGGGGGSGNVVVNFAETATTTFGEVCRQTTPVSREDVDGGY